MLNSRGVSEELEILYQQYKELAVELYTVVASQGKPFVLLREKNLFDECGSDMICYVKEGYLKLLKENREIRMYSSGDFIPTNGEWSRKYRIVSDFKSDLIQFSSNTLWTVISGDPEMMPRWTQMCDMERRLLLYLCGEFAPEIIDFEMVVKNFSSGETILTEGEEATAVYEMITGKANVYIGDKLVGTIGNSELFGELGFLTHNARNATVIATQNCFVRILEPHIFHHLIDTNSQFATTLLKNMAKRISQLNEKLLE
ncbi:MAG: cyclic nucleotide-binding domain-containing protein [Deltaproteobacteria bacterium]|nr:cyclic nucleotide-binding domain-containing protein [Deltaproteobacteria bacterium]MBN2671651.1 cyclic nucleotide-binding domain-containing protein [Deltaproteobacteria bacterium]